MVKHISSLGFCLLAALYCDAQITSTFDTDDDGWTFTAAVTHSATGGNTGGYISSTYSAAGSSTTQYWRAPSKFFGNLVVRSLGENLTFSMQQSHAGTTNVFTGDVRIENGGNAIVFELADKPAVTPEWTTYTIRLDETAGWTWNSGNAATREQIIYIMTNVTALEFRASYVTNASYTSGLDDVSIGQTASYPAPSITSFAPEAATPGSNVVISGAGFDPLPDNNVVYFGPVAAEVTSAAASALTVVVPAGAVYGGITVLNKTRGLMTRATTPFVPLFEGGGRIIPNSFDRKSDLSTSVNIDGFSVSDIDGDGWGDILIGDETNQTFKVYRNKGTGGDLTSASFEGEISFATGGSGANGAGLRTADLDGDGKLDVVTSANRSSTVGAFVTFRNTSTPGTISFEAPERWSGLRDESPPLNIADVDGDGRPDLMGCEGSISSSAWHYFWITQNISSPGDIEFAASRNFDFDMFAGVSGASIGDLNNDGKPEILVKATHSGTIEALGNISSPGTPAFEYLFSIPSSIQGGVQIADLNLDGHNDIMWKSNSGIDVRVRINADTDGVLTADDFQEELIFNSALGNYGGVALADINGDGKVDLVVADNGNIGIYENVFTGGTFDLNAFVTAYLHQGAGTSTYPTSVISADLNGDGKPDMVTGVTNTNPNRIALYENRNAHAPMISVATVSPLSGPVGSAVTITGNFFSPTLADNRVYFGAVEAMVTAATTTELTVTVPAGATYAPVSVRVGELTSRYHLPFNVTFSSGVAFDNTHFAPPVAFTLTDANYDIDVADLDRDGKPDLIAEASGGTYAFRNAHVSGVVTDASLVPDDTLPATFANPRLGDIDGDGFVDVVAVNGVMRRNMSAAGEISFAGNTSFGTGAGNLAFADFNLDGMMDVALTNGSAQLVLKENLSMPGDFVTGQFPTLGANVAFAKPSSGGGIVAGDFDGDGFADVVTTNPGSDNISFFRNLGILKISTGQFDTRVDITVGENPGRIYSGDLDVDGKIDLVLYHGTGASASELTVLHNQSTPGNVVFIAFTLALTSAATVAHIDDLDGDGRPEILVVSETGDRFSIFKNSSSPGSLDASSFAAPFNTGITNPRCVHTLDINLDGKPEVIITSAPNLLLVYENVVGNPVIDITTQPAAVTDVCEEEDTSLSLVASGGEPLTYRWQKYDGAGFVDLNDGGAFAGTSTATLNILGATATVGGDYRCRLSSATALPVISDTVAVVVNLRPAAPVVTGESACEGSAFTLVATGAADGQFRWYDVPVEGSALAGETSGSLTIPSLVSTTTYYASIHDGMCESARSAVVAEVLPLPTAPLVTNGFVCGSGTVELTATGASDGQYRWYDVATAGTALVGFVNGVFTTPDLSATTLYYAAINDGVCESPRVEVVADVYALPAPPAVEGITVCANAGATLVASGAADGDYRWYTSPSGGAQIADETHAAFTTPALAETTSFFVSVVVGYCESERTEAVATVIDCSNRAAPVITPPALTTHVGGVVTLDLLSIITDEDGDLDPTSLSITDAPSSGAIAVIDETHNLMVDYSGVSFSGMDHLTLSVCDALAFCTNETVTISVAGDVVVYNAVSPNGDGLNDVFVLQFIDAFDGTRENSVRIFDRWGDRVYSAENYDNSTVVFKGLNDNGTSLPSGVYFYKIEFASGMPGRSGYLLLKR